jgi:anhydro-N-acetylmuramic acid kinase
VVKKSAEMSLVPVVVAKNTNNVVAKNNLNSNSSYQDLYIGLMSGTSIDGVDGVIYDFATKTLVQDIFIPYSDEIKNTLLKITTTTTLKELANLELNLTDVYLQTIKQLLTTSQIAAKQIKAIGLHGQTVYHQGGVYTKQLGLGAKIAYESGILTINDFRSADIFAGGQGAPLTPKYHQYLLQGDGMVVNLGGIANITKIKSDKITGFDIGPANTLINNYALKHFGVDFDRDGLKARSGFIIQNLLTQMLDDEYFKLKAPKSTGVEYFNLEWLDSFLSGNEKPQDVLRTLTELSAITIANELSSGKAYFCGGGVFNKFLMERIAVLAPKSEILTTDELGVHPNFVEAVAFAYFAKLHIENKPANVPSVTGAKQEMILGTKFR